MRAPRVAARSAAPVDLDVVRPMSNGCGQTAALERIAAVLEALTAKGADDAPSVVERFAKAADALADLGAAQKKFCGLLVKHRVKLLLSVSVVLTAIGAISPTAADGVKAVLHFWGVR